jgi:hypothetical protein
MVVLNVDEYSVKENELNYIEFWTQLLQTRRMFHHAHGKRTHALPKEFDGFFTFEEKIGPTTYRARK